MPKRKPTDAEIDAEIAKLDLMPDAEARRLTDALLKRMLSSPPDPLTPKPKPRRKRKSAKPAK